MGPKNEEYSIRAINDGADGAKEITDYNLQNIVYSSSGKFKLAEDRTSESRNVVLGKMKYLADLLAEGDRTLDVIMSNSEREVLSYDEAVQYYNN